MRGIGIVLLAVLAGLVSSSPALAAFPGQNGKIAFADCGPSDCGIFVVNPDGSGRTQITHNTSMVTDPDPEDGGAVYRGHDLAPAWSADGQRIVFSREVVLMVEDGCHGGGDRPFNPEWHANIFTVDASGGDLTQLTAFVNFERHYETQPAWSPDGAEIAYAKHLEDFDEQFGCRFLAAPDLKKMNADGTAQQHLIFNGGAPSWSPDGALIVYDNNGHAIRTIAPTGGSGQTLAFAPASDDYVEPAWSPDGSRIAFGRGEGDVYIMDADGSDMAAVTNDGNSREPAFSPDGTKIAYTAEFSATNPDGTGISTMNPDGTGTATVTTTGTQADWQPVQPGYPRPKGATSVRASLVPAYIVCASPNRTHGPPLDSSSCSPPQQRSALLTTGTPDANGAAARMTGSVRLAVQAGNAATTTDEADVAVEISITDVRCRTTNAACPGGAGSDYEGRLLGVLTALRITDRLNTPPGPVGGPGTADGVLGMPVQCVATAGDPGVGSACSLSTTVDALLPGAIREGKRAVWELGQIHVRDAGPNGTGFESPACPPTCGDGDETLFLREGVFVP